MDSLIRYRQEVLVIIVLCPYNGLLLGSQRIVWSAIVQGRDGIEVGQKLVLILNDW